MNWLTAINSLILLAVLAIMWLKLAHGGDASSTCCAVIFLVMGIAAAALGLLIWGAGLLFGWWATPW